MTSSDNAGNSVTVPSTYRIVYDINGFFRPIENLPLLNITTAGSAVLVKFSLGGNQGLDIFQSGFPTSSPVACDATEPGTIIEETLTAGSSSLSYDGKRPVHLRLENRQDLERNVPDTDRQIQRQHRALRQIPFPVISAASILF